MFVKALISHNFHQAIDKAEMYGTSEGFRYYDTRYRVWCMLVVRTFVYSNKITNTK